MQIKTKILDKVNGKIPTKAKLSDAGWDLYSVEDVEINGNERKTVKTGIALEIPDGYVGLVWPRSGMAAKFGADILAGVIDSGYRGELMVCIYNTSTPLPLFETPQSVAIKIKKGDRIAQILFQRVPDFDMIEVEELSTSERGKSGFGSSGT